MAKVINKKIWMIFGAGGIGRGLLAPTALNSGYQIIFIAKDKEQTGFLNSIPKYSIKLLDKKSKKELIINNFKALNFQNKKEVIKAFSLKNLEIISTSVRPENLEEVAKTVAGGLKRRKEKKIKNPLIILTCENIIGGAKKLQNMVKEKGATIPEVLVDCIVPKQPSDSLIINREEYGKLFIEKGSDEKSNKILSRLINVKVVKDLPKYQVQKIFGLNGMHLSIALLGVAKGLRYVHQAVVDKEIKKILPRLITELTEAIHQATKFSKKTVNEYLKKVIIRFSNRKLPDENERIIRNLRKKLKAEERLLKPAQLVFETGQIPKTLISVIAGGIRLVMERGNISDPKKAIKEICQLPKKAESLEKRIIDVLELKV